MEKATVLWEDASLLAVEKEAGVASQGEKGRDLVSILKRETGAEVYPVHRLDRETAGVMIFAKTPRAAAALGASIAAGRWEKTYLAVTSRRLPEDEGAMEDLLYHDPVRNKSFPVRRPRRGVREARLEYRFLEEKNGFFLYEARPHTGRTHQIRVQFASRGCPLAGDAKYGGVRAGRLGLFARTLSFPHPETGERITVSAPDPTGFWEFYP